MKPGTPCLIVPPPEDQLGTGDALCAPQIADLLVVTKERNEKGTWSVLPPAVGHIPLDFVLPDGREGAAGTYHVRVPERWLRPIDPTRAPQTLPEWEGAHA
jgi:hypothetical protein